MKAFSGPVAFLFSILLTLAAPLPAQEKPRPALKDLMGVCGHTVQFKPELYRPCVKLVRDYHPIEWDLGDDTSSQPPFPSAANRVSWSHVYGSWRKQGFDINACLMFDNLPVEKWKDLERDAFAYGKAFASAFGPSGDRKLVDAIEIGNEPGKYDDPTYRKLFEAMARGAREGDPGLPIVTCAMNAGPSGDYFKSLDCVKGLESLYDAINVHTYAQIDNWPTWRRGHPESDKNIDYLSRVQAIIDWRNQNAAGKQIWITEFGWDATTKTPEPNGTFAKWVDVSDEQQAAYLVRSFFIFSSMDVDRAYIYFFNDSDEPHLHASSGLTRHFQPKPAYWAVKHLQQALGDYRLDKVLRRENNGVHLFAFRHAGDPGKVAWAAWLATDDLSARQTVTLNLGRPIKRMENLSLVEPIDNLTPPPADAEGNVQLEISGLPVIVWGEK